MSLSQWFGSLFFFDLVDRFLTYADDISESDFKKVVFNCPGLVMIQEELSTLLDDFELLHEVLFHRDLPLWPPLPELFFILLPGLHKVLNHPRDRGEAVGCSSLKGSHGVQRYQGLQSHLLGSLASFHISCLLSE